MVDNNNCGTHKGLQEALESTFKASLQEWFDNPTPANMTAFTSACEPFGNLEIVKLREEFRDEVEGPAKTQAKLALNTAYARGELASLVTNQYVDTDSLHQGPGHDPSGNEY